ncbi:MAG TPA: hypothetical protein VM283_07085 [Armatimonadota bacterium]|nr:hypothetical protein [Armatimonadota bacterium]
MKAVDANMHLLGRWVGRNERPDTGDRQVIAELLRLFEQRWPDAAGFKELNWPYPEVWREVWPGCPIIHLTRGLLGFLCCIARRRGHLYEREPWWYDIGEEPPWNVETEALIEHGFVEERLRPLVRAALHRRVHHQMAAQCLPPDALRVSYEQLYADWDYWLWKLLTHCGLPVPQLDGRVDWLEEQAHPRHRRWDKSPFTRDDVERVMEVCGDGD